MGRYILSERARPGATGCSGEHCDGFRCAFSQERKPCDGVAARGKKRQQRLRQIASRSYRRGRPGCIDKRIMPPRAIGYLLASLVIVGVQVEHAPELSNSNLEALSVTQRHSVQIAVNNRVG